MKIKIVAVDGVIHGICCDKEAVRKGITVDIMDADSGTDADKLVEKELDNSDMIMLEETVTRHPGEERTKT